MIRTIRQRIYVFGLLPLALLAVAFVTFNGFSRIGEARQELNREQMLTAALLQSPATDALVLGNITNFDKTVRGAIAASPSLLCVTLSDENQQLVSRIGKCDVTADDFGHFKIVASKGGFSDLNLRGNATDTIGELGVLMTDATVVHKGQMVALQLVLSLIMVAIVVGLTGRLLRARLVEPIRAIGSAMQALSRHDYDARVPVQGQDELTRLAEAVNYTIVTTAEYTQELERRRSDADRALHDADEVSLALRGVVRSMTEDIEAPMEEIHSNLLEIARVNSDPALKDRIRSVIALLQEAHGDFADLIDVASNAQLTTQPRTSELTGMLADIQHDFHQLSATEHIAVKFVPTHIPLADVQRGESTKLILNMDGERVKKALIYLTRLMSRRCRQPGVYVTAEFMDISANKLHVSLHLKAFYDLDTAPSSLPWFEESSRYGNLAATLGWTDRESKIVDYLLRTVGITPTLNTSAGGAVSVLLETTCQYAVAENACHPSSEWKFATRPVSTTLVSDDAALMRFTRRGDLSQHEFTLLPHSIALANTPALAHQDAVMVDISDMAEAANLLNQLKAQNANLPHLIAICPAGPISDALRDRLSDLGFEGMIQKPLHYSQLIDVLRRTLR